MPLKNGAEWNLDSVDLKDGEPNVFTSVGLPVEGANGDILPCDNVVPKSLEDVFRTALDVGHDRRA